MTGRTIVQPDVSLNETELYELAGFTCSCRKRIASACNASGLIYRGVAVPSQSDRPGLVEPSENPSTPGQRNVVRPKSSCLPADDRVSGRVPSLIYGSTVGRKGETDGGTRADRSQSAIKTMRSECS